MILFQVLILRLDFLLFLIFYYAPLSLHWFPKCESSKSVLIYRNWNLKMHENTCTSGTCIFILKMHVRLVRIQLEPSYKFTVKTSEAWDYLLNLVKSCYYIDITYKRHLALSVLHLHLINSVSKSSLTLF